jgi:DNA segregation ATPase FtsK/SpoIIIE, S-DNA-T family
VTAAPPSAPTTCTTRCWTLHGPDGAIDVEITALDGDTLGAVLPALSAAVGCRDAALWAGSTPLPSQTPLTAAELRHGAVLGLGRPGPRLGSREGSSALELRILGGPDAGRTLPLTQGRHVLGRGADATVHLEDPDISRRHAVVQVGGGLLTVADLGSTNGTRLDGEPLDGQPRPWPAGSRLRLGASTVSVAGATTCPVAVQPGGGGRLLVRTVPGVNVPPRDVEVALPPPPDPPSFRRLPWAAITLPAVGGAAMAWLLHTPTFLFFAVLGPLVGVGNWASDRWSGRRRNRRDAVAHAMDLLAAEQRIADAVRADRRAAEAAHPDLAALSAAARRRCAPLWSRSRSDPDALTVRLGLGPGLTRVTRVQPDGTRIREAATDLPVLLDLRATGGLGIVGPPPWTTTVLCAVLTQLAVLHPPGEVDVLLLTDPRTATAWAWARWLPHLRAEAALGKDDQLDGWLATVVAQRRAGADRAGPSLVVVVDRPLDPRLTQRLETSRDAGIVLVAAAGSGSALPVGTGALLRATGDIGDAAGLTRDGCPDEVDFVVDRLSPRSAGAVARDLACLLPATPATRLPGRLRLLDLPGPGLRVDAAGRVAGTWLRHRDRLMVTLGVTETEVAGLDLCREGPHALIAGTTGSGKSELLQTLIASLALAHPPDRCSLLLVDYKGGAAFAAATALPHTVGVLTDLDGQATGRALRSLGAELTRRERLLADHHVNDLADLPGEVDLARLVIVVDEFATLAEELPEFVPGLVGIAQRGRSLGVHLILATQRPSGVVSPEIRANCTLRICLRTTDEADSRDVLGSPDAANLPVELPGRGFLRTGNGAPVPFQAARVATGPEPDATPSVRRAGPQPVGSRPEAEDRRPELTDLARAAGALRRAAGERGIERPHRPWLPPLEERLDAAELGRPAGRRVRLGLLDRPETQSRQPLDLDLDVGGTWLAVGGPRSGRTTLLRTVLAGAVATSAPDELHVHVLDHGSGVLAAEAARLPHAGTCVGGADAFRTVRLLDRLGQEVSARRAGNPAAPAPRLLLLVDGVDALMTQLDECDPAGGSAAFLRLARDGAAAGLTCVLTTDRAVSGSRLAAAAQQRLVLPLPDPADYAVAGLRPGAVPARRPPGRALLVEDGAECQLALPLPLPRAGDHTASRIPGGPLRIIELPADPAVGREAGRSAGARGVDGDSLPVVLGPGGDEGLPLVLDLGTTGGLLVVGPPGSGRSSTLRALAAQLRELGAFVLSLAPAERPGGPDPALDPRDAAGIATWLADAGPRTAVVVADDVGAAQDWPALAVLPARTGGRGPVLLASGGAADLAGHYQGPLAALRRARQGLLLSPGPLDADLLGIRLPRTPLPVRPGSGWLAGPRHLQRVQIARRRVP